MKMSLNSFFKKGELWSGLEGTLESITKTLKVLSKRVQNLSHRESILIEHIKHLKADNLELKNRMDRIEERMWGLNIVSNSNQESIIKDISPNAINNHQDN